MMLNAACSMHQTRNSKQQIYKCLGAVVSKAWKAKAYQYPSNLSPQPVHLFFSFLKLSEC